MSSLIAFYYEFMFTWCLMQLKGKLIHVFSHWIEILKQKVILVRVTCCILTETENIRQKQCQVQMYETLCAKIFYSGAQKMSFSLYILLYKPIIFISVFLASLYLRWKQCTDRFPKKYQHISQRKTTEILHNNTFFFFSG